MDERGLPTAVEAKAKVPMMDLIAEMMIWANAEVAERIATVFPGCALLRNHPPPSSQAFDRIRPMLEFKEGGNSGGAGGGAGQLAASMEAAAASTLDLESNVAVAAALSAACRRARDPAAAQVSQLRPVPTASSLLPSFISPS